MLDEQIENFINTLLRKELSMFSVKNIQSLLLEQGVKIPAQEVSAYLQMHPYVTQLANKKYITRAGCFTGRFFSVKPSKYEIEQGIFVPGDRCMPFVDPQMLPDELTFVFNGKNVEHCTGEYSTSELLDHYILFGEEYSAQYLALDPCNSEQDFSINGFELPSRMKLTVVDMAELYQSWNFQYGDRLVLYVIDWDKGVVSLSPSLIRKENPFEQTAAEEKRKKWYSLFKHHLLASFKQFGPCGSMEEQLAAAFLSDIPGLTDMYCGSVEEFLEQTDKISIVEYGVESRLWRTDSEIPAAGNWVNEGEESDVMAGTLYGVFGLPMPDYIVEAFILDSLYQKEETSAKIFSRILPDETLLSSFQQSLLILHLERQHAIIKKSYNWFADYEIGEIRNQALKLYSQILCLICELDRCNLPVDRFPQQELVILSQLYGHTGKMIEAFLFQKGISEKDISAASLSLEGMNFSFVEIQGPLRAALKQHQLHAFSIVKKDRKDGRKKHN
ncbi:MAG: hypothetical protein KBT02_04725 [Treponema sp.]|nr:hypothetical protein [Candidatus Treponema caballi]